jgi:hypothetical protein
MGNLMATCSPDGSLVLVLLVTYIAGQMQYEAAF